MIVELGYLANDVESECVYISLLVRPRNIFDVSLERTDKSPRAPVRAHGARFTIENIDIQISRFRYFR